jgi:hypothetical protein
MCLVTRPSTPKRCDQRPLSMVCSGSTRCHSYTPRQCYLPRRDRRCQGKGIVAVEFDQGDVAPGLPSLPYQNLLRSVGAYLDERPASQICVLEVEESFLVRYQPRHHQYQVLSARFGLEDVNSWDRRRQRERSETPQTARPPARGAYQDNPARTRA